jgi:hypothetical protein
VLQGILFIVILASDTLYGRKGLRLPWLKLASRSAATKEAT